MCVLRPMLSSAVAREILKIDKPTPKLGLSIEGYVTNANYNMKKSTFILFINHRLVDSNAIKKGGAIFRV